MELVVPSLYASGPEPLGFGPSLEIRAFLLIRKQGNVLLYRSAALREAAKQIADLGGIERQYLNHWHEASAECDWVSATFGAPLYCPAAEVEEVAQRCRVDHTVSDREVVDGDLEIIPAPGHTPGATCFLWDTGERRCLFCGDTISFPRGSWRAAVLESSDRDQYLASLELIRSLEFDVIAPSVSASGQPFYDIVDRDQAQARIESLIRTINDGG
jgi:glyoxylase-like metal-dependent hydrolase (beta-lactamase superfamily II)